MAKKKLTRAERKAEEERVVAEMDEAMRAFQAEKAKAEASAPLQEDADNAKEKENSPSEQQGDAGISQSDAVYGPSSVPMPQQIHCRKCGTVMENGVCPKCGYKLYVPMDGKKLNLIRWIVGGICVAAFVVWLIIKSVKG